MKHSARLIPSTLAPAIVVLAVLPAAAQSHTVSSVVGDVTVVISYRLSPDERLFAAP